MASTNGKLPNGDRDRRWHLWIVAVWCGAAVMAFELTGARLLMPDFGMGIDVWSAVIATTLGSLALGYGIGGRIADARPSVASLAVVLLLAAASLMTVRYLGTNVPRLFTGLSFTAAAWCSAGLVVAVPLFLLGMVQPILVRLMIRAKASAGSLVGGLLAVSTVGGVFGTALTAIVLIPRIGVSNTLFLLGTGTAAMAVLALAGDLRWRAAAGALIVTAILAAAGWRLAPAQQSAGPMRVLEQVDGLYGNLEVLEYHGTRAILCNGIFQTALPVEGLGVVPGTLIRGRDYIELIPYLRPRTRSALLIGLGGGQHELALACYGIRTHCVEIEPAMVPLAAEYFGSAVEITVADGRAFLARDTGQYDAVILDTFQGGTVPEHLYTKEAFQQIANRLTPDGLLVIHMISHPQHPATCAVTRTLQAVFPHTTAVRSGFGDELQHLYLFASREAVELFPEYYLELDRYGFTRREFFDVETDGAPMLTDDRSCLGLLARSLVAEHRFHSQQLRRRPPW